VPKKQGKRGRLWFNDGSCVRLRSERQDHVWACDFVQARTHNGRSFRMLTLVDEFTRECLAIDVARQLNREDVLEPLAWLMATRGVADHIRSDNGPEFTAKVLREWFKRVGVKTLFIEPGRLGRTVMWTASMGSWQMNNWSEKCSTRWRRRR